MTDGALQNVKVVELGHFGALPCACAILADWGADVIKVENPKGGDPMRGFLTSEVEPGNVNPWFNLWNRNKRSLTLDLKQEDGTKILHRLVANADVFATNYELRLLERIGADYDTLAALNPKLVYALLTGYGTQGPDRYKPGFDYVAFWARSGVSDRMSEPGRPPRPARGGYGDSITATVMAGSIGTALFARDRSRVGQKVEFSLYQIGAWALGFDNETALHFGQQLSQTDRRQVSNPLWNDYQTKDGKWVFLAMVQSDLYWSAFCKAIGRPEWEKDPRFESHLKRMKENVTLIDLIGEAIADRTYSDWQEVFTQYGLIFGPISTPLDVVKDPQAWQNNFFTEVDHPSCGRLRLLQSPIHFSQTPASVRVCAPELGQHTEEILLALDYTWDNIGELKSRGVIL